VTPVDRLVRTRRQQRDAAADELARARRRLEELEAEQARLETECRENLRRCVGTDDLSLSDLECMDTSRRCVEAATTSSATAFEDAQQLALEYQRMLRQVEILRERLQDREAIELRRHERRELDEIASRRALRKLLALPLLLCLAQQGCGKDERAAADSAASPADAGATRREAKAPASQPASRPASQPASQPTSRPASRPVGDGRRDGGVKPKHDSMVFSFEELEQLAKLKRRGKVGAAPSTQPVKPIVTATPKISVPPRPAPAPTPPRPTQTLVDLVQVLREMKLRPAAAMLAEMDPGTAAAALQHLPPADVARILSQMPADRAAPIGTRLAAKRAKDAESKHDAGAPPPAPRASKTPRPGGDGGAAAAATQKKEARSSDAGHGL
jgi:hypothetical protein